MEKTNANDYLNTIDLNKYGDNNIIRELDPHNKLLKELETNFSNMSYAYLSDFVGNYYVLDESQQPFPELRQKVSWNMMSDDERNAKFGYFLKNGITPEEIISVALSVYNKYNEFNKTGKVKR